MKVLLADESRAIRSIYRSILKKTSYASAETVGVENGLEALRWIRHGNHGRVLLIADWDLPELNGRALMEHLRGQKEPLDITVLFCVNKTQAHLAQEALGLGSGGFILRPFSDEDFRAKIESMACPDLRLPASVDRDVLRDVLATAQVEEHLPSLLRLPSSLIRDLFESIPRSTHAPGTPLIRAGDLVESLTFVMSGEVELVSSTDPACTEFRGTGECFGERALVCGEPSKVAVWARTGVDLASVPKDRLVDLARRHGAVRDFLQKLLTHPPVGTEAVASGAPVSELCGNLGSLPFPELLQFLNTTRKTGILTLTTGVAKGRIYLEAGEVCDARVNGVAGEPAFFEMAAWAQAQFEFTVQAALGPRSIAQSTMKLLIEAYSQRSSLPEVEGSSTTFAISLAG